MKIAVLGTGMVGVSIGNRLIELGHQVMMGSRSADNEKVQEWVKGKAGSFAGTFNDAVKFGEIIFNCTKGSSSVEVLKSCDQKALEHKILVDVANPLDFSKGMPPSLSIVNTDSLGETLQRMFPQLRVVKALNTMNCNLMVDPALIPGDHHLFICGNHEDAKRTVSSLLVSFGWKESNLIDLGDISNARATEQLLPIWIRLYGKLEDPMFNFSIVRASKATV